MTGRRIVSVLLPTLAMERWRKASARRGDPLPDDAPLALCIEGAHGPVVHAVNRAAAQAGVTVGAPVVDMRALCPSLRVDYADLQAETALRDRLVHWVRRWAPWSAPDGPTGLVIDTTGSDHLWGGEATMLADMEAQFSHLGLGARLAVAPTWGAAWALARFGAVRARCTDAALADTLAPLPVTALRLDAETVLLLRRLGLKTVGALAAVPRLSLARRFARHDAASNPLLRLDQALGRMVEPVGGPGDPVVFRALVRLAEPVQDPTAFLPGLCRDLCAQLAVAGQGCRRLAVRVFRTDGTVGTVTAATAAASRDAAHLCQLFAERIAQIDPGYGFDLIALEAAAVEPLAARQSGLDGREEPDLALSRLVDRLAARFGAQAVTRPVAQASHLPERAERLLTALAPQPLATEAPPQERPQDRPLRLLAPPEEVRVLYAVPEGPPAQFLWRRQTLRVRRYAGPERIAPEWWHDRPGTRLRDYYKVEVETGERFWMYREGLHADRRGGDPRWFLHGVFA